MDLYRKIREFSGTSAQKYAAGIRTCHASEGFILVMLIYKNLRHPPNGDEKKI